MYNNHSEICSQILSPCWEYTKNSSSNSTVFHICKRQAGVLCYLALILCIIMYSVFVHIGKEAYSASCSVVTGWGVSLTTHLEVVPFLRMSGIRPPLFLRAFMACISVTSNFTWVSTVRFSPNLSFKTCMNACSIFTQPHGIHSHRKTIKSWAFLL
jgi:hypothetical protein